MGKVPRQSHISPKYRTKSYPHRSGKQIVVTDDPLDSPGVFPLVLANEVARVSSPALSSSNAVAPVKSGSIFQAFATDPEDRRPVLLQTTDKMGIQQILIIYNWNHNRSD